MNYVIAILPDRIQAEAAYGALETAGLPLGQVSIVGPGYKSADDYDFLEPFKATGKQIKQMALWLVPFGFVAGIAFNLSTQYQLVEWAGRTGNQILGGVFGAIGGAMGSFFMGSGLGLTSSTGDALPYRKRLKQGKYIVIVNGSPNLTNKATSILRQFKPENLQTYVDPTTV